MATHDYVIDNSTGANVRADLNLVLQAILSNNSSSSAPSTTAAYMWWADTTNGILKIRNSANNAWVELLQLDGTLTLEDGSNSAPALAFRDDLNTGVFSSDADHFNIATGGTERVKFGTAGVAFNDGGADYDFRIESDTNVNCFTLDAAKSSIGINVDPATGYSLDILGISGYDDVFRITGVGTNIGPRMNLTPTGTGVARINATANSFQLQTGGSTALTIDTSQRLLIGQTSSDDSTSMLQVKRANNSTIRIASSDATATNFAAIDFAPANSVQGAAIICVADADFSSSANQDAHLRFLTIKDGTLAEAMRIDSSGRVGIGVTSVSSKLHLDSGGSTTTIQIDSDTESSIKFNDHGGSAKAYRLGTNINGNDSQLVIYDDTRSAEVARFSSDGKFLMGTTGSLDLGLGPQVLSIRGGNAAGYDGTAAAIFGQLDNDAATCIFYNASDTNGTNMLDTRCARTNNAAYTFHVMRSNSASDTEFRWRGDGNAFADGSFSGGGADYAEYFEWADGNSSDEDRRGYTVVLDGNKIRKSTSSDAATTIIGVVSSNPSIIGDGDLDKWKQKYQQDDYGTYLRDSNGERVLNSDWDESIEYVSREDRKEWSIVGLMGKIRISKGQTMGTNWIKMQDISATVEEWLVR